MRTRFLAAALVALLAIPGAASAIKVGQTAPDFLLEDVRTGQPISLSAQAGKVVVLVFFEPG